MSYVIHLATTFARGDGFVLPRDSMLRCIQVTGILADSGWAGGADLGFASGAVYLSSADQQEFQLGDGTVDQVCAFAWNHRLQTFAAADGGMVLTQSINLASGPIGLVLGENSSIFISHAVSAGGSGFVDYFFYFA